MTSADNSGGNSDVTLRVAIVGAGPAGFFAALDLLARESVGAHVDLFDRLPAPYGLVRYGVAPDHAKIRRVTAVFDRGVEAAGDRFRFFGNVEVGTDVSLDELRERYHAVILSYGAQTDRELGVPGEQLPQVYAAREFVAWYNGHPDFAAGTYDLTAEAAMVIGVGNVAIDVARILARRPEELRATDMSDAAIAALVQSNVRAIQVVARRGPLQAKMTPAELLEITKMAEADLVVTEDDLLLDALSQAALDSGSVARQTRRNLEIMRDNTLRSPRPGRRYIRLRFYLSPVEFVGADRLGSVRLRRNTLAEREGGYLAAVPTEETETVDCGVAFRSIGYRVAPLAGVPFDPTRSRIPHVAGHVLTDEDGAPVEGLFVAGWAKRGPSGVIGTNKPDAVETVSSVLGALERGALPAPQEGDVADLLQARGVTTVTYAEWKRLDALEVAAGEADGRPRRRFVSVAEMLAALGKAS